jgi:hypothetical protein
VDSIKAVLYRLLSGSFDVMTKKCPAQLDSEYVSDPSPLTDELDGASPNVVPSELNEDHDSLVASEFCHRKPSASRSSSNLLTASLTSPL